MIPWVYIMIKFAVYTIFLHYIILFIGPLTDKEIEEIAENIDLNISDLEDLSDDDLIEENKNIRSVSHVEDDKDDDFGLSDDEPLIHFVSHTNLTSDFKWTSSEYFTPSVQNVTANVHSTNGIF